MYKQYTPFGIESVEVQANSQVSFGQKSIYTLNRVGDLAGPTMLQATLPALTANSGQTVAWTHYVGHVLCQMIDFLISGGRVDRLHAEILQIWYELTCQPTKEVAYKKMIGELPVLTTQAASIPAYTVYVPFPLWFSLHYGNALPLLAMQFNTVTIEVTFAPITQLYITSDGSPLTAPTAPLSASLYVDYIFLDQPERESITQDTHQYLVQVWQFNGFESYSSTNIKPRLTFNHPVKEIYWVLRLNANEALGNWMDFSNSGTSNTAWNGGQTVASANLTLNGNDRMALRNGEYYNYVKAYQAHSRCPSVGVYSYNFAIWPELPTPTGSQNMSRVDSAILNLNTNTGTNVPYKLGVYALSLNLFRVRLGQSGLSFSS